MLKIVPLLFFCYLFGLTTVQAQVLFNPSDYLQKWPKIKPAVSVSVKETAKPLLINCGCGSKKPEDQPVFVIDDKQTADGLGSLNPNQIEKIDVSRDEKWVKLYGDQAKNGVIFITLKKLMPSGPTAPTVY